MPAQAAKGLRLCQEHADQLREDAIAAGQLYMDLESQLQPHRRGIGERVSGSRDLSPVPREVVIEARNTILNVLRRLWRAAAAERGLPTQKRDSYLRSTLDELSDDAKARLAELGVGGQSDVATSTTRRLAAEAEVLAALVAGQARWFAAHPHAGTFATALHDAVHCVVLRVAYLGPQGTSAIAICPCGGRVARYQAPSDVAACDSCGAVAGPHGWDLTINRDAVVDTVAGAHLLSHLYGRTIRPSVIAGWASRGHVPRLTDENGQPVRDARGRQLYKLSDLEACAATRRRRSGA